MVDDALAHDWRMRRARGASPNHHDQRSKASKASKAGMLMPETTSTGVASGAPDHLMDGVPSAAHHEWAWLERNFGWVCLGLVLSITAVTFTDTVIFGTTSVASYGITWILTHIVFLCIVGIAEAIR